MNRNILIFVPHCDDDILSFGGLMTHAIRKGCNVKVHVFTCGGPCSNVPQVTRFDEFRSVMKFMKIDNYVCTGYGLDGKLDTLPQSELTTIMDNDIQEFKPDEVYCGAYSEHQDHRALYNAFLAAARLKVGFMPSSFAIGTYPFSNQLYSESSGGKIFLPMTEDEFKIKCQAFSLYESQMKQSPSPLGLDGLRITSEYNGMLCGSPYAELYYQLRYIKTL